MVTFIIAVVFWPITLLYLFLVYVLPFILQVMFFMGYSLVEEFRRNPLQTSIMVLVGLVFLNWMSGGSSEEKEKAKKKQLPDEDEEDED